MKILGIECCTKACSAALYEDGKITASFSLNGTLTHSETLLPIIKSIYEISSSNLDDTDYIAVTIGPGSFTGIRIGLATAKGIAQGKDKPMIGLSSLEALCYNVSDFDGIICPCLDARRAQVYNAVFEFREGNLFRLCEDRALSVDELKDELKKYDKPIMFLGDGARLVYDSIADGTKKVFAGENDIYLRADSVCLAAANEVGLCTFRPQNFKDITPVYLRLSQAEREKKERESK